MNPSPRWEEEEEKKKTAAANNVGLSCIPRYSSRYRQNAPRSQPNMRTWPSSRGRDSLTTLTCQDGAREVCRSLYGYFTRPEPPLCCRQSKSHILFLHEACMILCASPDLSIPDFFVNFHVEQALRYLKILVIKVLLLSSYYSYPALVFILFFYTLSYGYIDLYAGHHPFQVPNCRIVCYRRRVNRKPTTPLPLKNHSRSGKRLLSRL
ncbi:hypothetical protein F5Y11DRAFT_208760 [Daldinia sp. FL1419]|nr:hypothetical protein F5Y11DRAFT_208760 [Daldinia sp. FL1419]